MTPYYDIEKEPVTEIDETRCAAQRNSRLTRWQCRLSGRRRSAISGFDINQTAKLEIARIPSDL
jgi:hypothetical protein